MDALRACDKVCFTVYGNETIREEAWAPFMQSVVVFGRCHLMEAGPETTAQLFLKGKEQLVPGTSQAYKRLEEAKNTVAYMEHKVLHYQEILAGLVPDDTNPGRWTEGNRPQQHRKQKRIVI